MTWTLAVTKSKDGNTECTVEYEKFGCFRAFVYEKRGEYNWVVIHKSQPTDDEKKAIEAYKRFVRRYINEN